MPTSIHMPTRYAELHCLSHFSFQRGASSPAELVERAIALGYAALAITDECSLAGVVRAHEALQAARARGEDGGLALIIGAEFRLQCGLRLVLLACQREGYGNLSSLISLARRRSEKGEYRISRADFVALSPTGAVPDCLALWLAGETATLEQAQWVKARFGARAWLAVELLCGPDDSGLLAHWRALGAASELPLVAAGDVHMHVRARRRLQDALVATAQHCSVFTAGHALFPNGERHLRHPLRLARLYPPELLAATLTVAARCQFSLSELRYDYPEEIVPAGHTPSSWLRHETEAGLARRYPQGPPASVRAGIEHELALIAELRYEAFFLTVYDVVCFARSRGILCQGRGSAANSSVCYALGITEVDPARAQLLFERFISRERHEAPDIDVDFEHQRREEVIQYLYGKYGRERAALAATVIRYRTRSALRDMGRAMDFGREQIDALTRSLAWWDKREQLPARLAEQGLDPASPRVAQWLALAQELIGSPRHLSQHVGGFVISRGPLARLVPVENAAMPERTVIQWDKDDLETLGLLKVDVLALGMLSAIGRSLALVAQRRRQAFTLSDIPAKDAATFDMLCRADSVGVFQVESRAQMSMLPRLRPRNYYDLVVQVAIVRPGPIQGDMVHPYLHRRQNPAAAAHELAALPRPLREVLARTQGVPIFQEQVMKLAEVGAGFTPGEADQLRRAMASWRHKGHIEQFKQRLREGMRARGHPEDFAAALCRQIEGFGEYGFPESHAASFALLAYASAWLKCHEPEAFLCGLLNSQPMGFYAPAQLVQDARRHGVEVRGVDINTSHWEAQLEMPPDPQRRPAVRLGLNTVRGLDENTAQRILAARAKAPFCHLDELAARAELGPRSLKLLAAANSLGPLAGHRRQALWAASGVQRQGDLFDALPSAEAPAQLSPPSVGQEVRADYATLGLSLGPHPLALLRPRLDARRFLRASELAARGDRAVVRSAGLVTSRQRPGTATGVVFITLEDESGHSNIIVHAKLAARQHRELLSAGLLGVYGQLQREGSVVHLIAKRLVDLSPWLGALNTRSRDFH